MLDHRSLVRLLVDWALLIGMAHEFPAVSLSLLGDAGVILAAARIDELARFGGAAPMTFVTESRICTVREQSERAETLVTALLTSNC